MLAGKNTTLVRQPGREERVQLRHGISTDQQRRRSPLERTICKGFDSYNPATGQVASHQRPNEIECLMIDTDYDGSAFFARGIHFPGQSEDRRLKRLKARLGAQLDPAHW